MRLSPSRGRTMRLFLWISGIALALFSLMHVFITFEHWRQVGPHRESVIVPASFSLVAAALALVAFRRVLREGAST